MSDPAQRSMILLALTTRVWKKASRSTASGCCVECLALDDLVLIRDSKYRRDGMKDVADEPVIALRRVDWDSFTFGLDRDSSNRENGAVRMNTGPDGTKLESSDGVVLEYTPDEWDAFTAAVLDGEFANLQ